MKGIECTLMTSHLESTADFSDERKHQLQQAFKAMTAIPHGQPVIFGGDLNLRDKEVRSFVTNIQVLFYCMYFNHIFSLVYL